jgi:tetratricopeptide (TPR) repeat protein
VETAPLPDQLEHLRAALADRYAIEREVGSGGMATVYLAQDLKHRRQVAVKVLAPELAAALGPERFLREIEISAGLDHPHILPLYDSGQADRFLYYVMPYVEGESLRERLNRERQLPLDDARQIAREVADALSYAHSRAVVHRDIKPENILLAGGHARVADFGIARAVTAAGGDRLTQTGMAIGTPLYMSPEQAAGDQDLDGRSDLYSLACVLYEMLAGQPPFTGPPESMLAQHLTAEPPNVTTVRPAVPPEVSAALTRALAKTPADRFNPVAQFADALESRGATVGTTAPAATGPTFAPTPIRTAAVFGTGSLLLLALVYLLVIQVGLPMWVFVAAVALLVIGLPLVVATSLAEQRRGDRSPAGIDRWLTWRRVLLGGGLAFGGLVIVTGAYEIMRVAGLGPAATLISSGAISDRERLILADFENRTSDSTQGATVTELMRIGLSRSTAVSIMDPLQLGRTLQRMQRDPADGVPPEIALEAAEREGLKGVITGAVSTVGSGLAISVRLVAVDGEVLLAETQNARTPDELVDAVDQLSSIMRERFGESLRRIRQSQPLDQVTTGSVRALRLFSQGLQAWNQGDNARAMQLIDESIAEDSTFAMAYRKLAIILSNQGQQRSRAVEAANKAYEYRERLTERERYLVIAAYHSVVTGNRDQQISAYRTVLDLHPDDTYALNNLGVIYGELRDFPRAADYYGRALDVDPTLRLHFSNLSTALGRQELFDSADAIARSFEQRFPDNPEVKLAYLLNAAMRQDYDSAEVLAAGLLADQRGTVFWEAIAYEWWGHLDALQGKLASARRRWRTAFEITGDRGLRGQYLTRTARRAIVERLLLDDEQRALRLLNEALALHPLDELPPLDRPYGHLALAFAAAGAPDRAETLLAEFETTPEADHSEDAEIWTHGARGVIALAEGRPEEAVAALRQFDDGNSCATCAYPWLARAYDRLGEEDSVRVLYERFANLPSASLWYDGGHLAYAYQRLGEIYEAREDVERAAQYYSRLMELWDEADPELQAWVETARSALERLGREPRSVP